MPRGDKGSYTDKQKRQAEHIEEGYEDRGVSKDEAERRAWATVNASSGGGKKSGSGRGKEENKAPREEGRQEGRGLAERGDPLPGREEGRRDAQAQRGRRLEEGREQERLKQERRLEERLKQEGRE